MENIRKPWTQGPFELIQHADGHMQELRDVDRKIALIGFDNAIEVCIDVFVQLHPRLRGGYEIKNEDIKTIRRNFHSKIDFLATYLEEQSKSLKVPIEEILWFHSLRNELYHSGNGMVPEMHIIQRAKEAAINVFEGLFDEKYENEDSKHEAGTEDKISVSDGKNELYAGSNQVDSVFPMLALNSEMMFISGWMNFEKLLLDVISPRRRDPYKFIVRDTKELWDSVKIKLTIPDEYDVKFDFVYDVRNKLVHHRQDITDNLIEDGLVVLYELHTLLDELQRS